MGTHMQNETRNRVKPMPTPVGADEHDPSVQAPADNGDFEQSDQGLHASDENARRERIALAAYYHAERRGFVENGELDDWLTAEKEVDGKQ